jgi:hypothetical protein
MPVSSYYQAQPDGYVRFDWRGNSIEGEFFSYVEWSRYRSQMGIHPTI